MEEDYKAWIEYAKVNLKDFEMRYNEKHYSLALHELQQAEEKTAKAILLKMNLADQSPGLSQLASSLGIPLYPPIKYGHNWRENMLNQLEAITKSPFAAAILETSKSLPGMESLGDPQKLIANARNAKTNQAPTTQEISDIIMDCNKLLNSVVDMRKAMVDKINPIKGLLNPLNVHLDKEFGKKIDLISFVDAPVNTAVASFILITIAILDTILRPFESSRFPDSTKSVGAFEGYFFELRDILQKCIEFAEE